MQLLIVIYRTLFFYFFITLLYRIMGKREIGQLGIVDLIVSILIAELVAISIENEKEAMYLTIVPIIVLVLLEIILGMLSLKSRKFRQFIDGKPSLIISEGKINYCEMVRQRYSLDDLLLALRQNEVNDIMEIEYAFLESNGKLSIFRYNRKKARNEYPLPIIVDGIVDYDALKHIKKNLSWLNGALLEQGYTVSEVFYAFYKNNLIYFIKKGSR